MSEVNQIKLFVKSVYLKFKRIDILINNAGIQLNKKMEKVTQEDYLKVINNNLSSYYFFKLCRKIYDKTKIRNHY